MMGTIKINVGMGLFASIVTFMTAFAGNVWIVSLERSIVAFILFFLAAFPVRWLLFVLIPPARETEQQTEANDLGQHIDLVAESDLDELENAGETTESDPSDTFTPLVPPRIEKQNDEPDPADIANMIRRLTDQ